MMRSYNSYPAFLCLYRKHCQMPLLYATHESVIKNIPWKSMFYYKLKIREYTSQQN